MSRGHRVCPSTSLDHATHLLGVVGSDGTVHPVRPALALSDEFVEKVTAVGSPERRFRFVGACIESGCRQWTGTRCGVIDDVLDQVNVHLSTTLRPCPIRRDCRWFAQRQARACEVCPLVVTDARLTEAKSERTADA